MRVQLPYDAATPGSHPIHFEIERDGLHSGDAAVKLREKSTFVVPR